MKEYFMLFSAAGICLHGNVLQFQQIVFRPVGIYRGILIFFPDRQDLLDMPVAQKNGGQMCDDVPTVANGKKGIPAP